MIAIIHMHKDKDVRIVADSLNGSCVVSFSQQGYPEGELRLSREQADFLATRLCQWLQDTDPKSGPLPGRDPTPPADYWGEPLEVNDSQ